MPRTNSYNAKELLKHPSRTLAKDQNLTQTDRCHWCGLVPDMVRRCGSRYRPICWSCSAATTPLAALAREIEALLEKCAHGKATSDMEERADLISDICYDLSNETGIDATHPEIIRAYLLATFEAMNRKRINFDGLLKSEVRAKRSIDDLKVLAKGCSKKRFRQIYQHHNPHHYEAKGGAQ